MMTTEEALTNIKKQLRIKQSTKSFTDAELLSFIDDILPHFLAMSVKHDVDRFVIRRIFSDLDTTVVQYNDRWQVTFEEPIFFIRKFAKTFGREVIQLRYIDINQPFAFWSFYSKLGDSADWTIVGNRKLLIGTNPAQDDYEIWYVPKPPKLVTFNPTGGATDGTTIECNATIPLKGSFNVGKGAYAGQTLVVTATSDNKAPEKESREVKTSEITTYPTLKFTLDKAFSDKVQSGDTVELALPFQDHGDDLAILEAVSRAFNAEGNERSKRLVGESKSEAHQVYASTTNPLEAETRYVRYIPR